MSEHVLRIATALVAAPLTAGLLYAGGWVFGGAVAVVGVLAQQELYAMAEARGLAPWRVGGAVLAALVALVPLWPGAAALLGAGAVGLLVGAPFLLPRDGFLEHLGATALGVVYPAGFLAYLTRLRLEDAGAGALAPGMEAGLTPAFWVVLTVFLTVWSADVFAYYAGRAFGRHAFAPSISPKKTWEGFAGGFAGAVLVAAGARLVVLPDLPWAHALALGALAGGVGPLGDLAESQLKRATGLKDASSFLPGHGGLLDRFDSMAAVAPLVYLYLQHVAH